MLNEPSRRKPHEWEYYLVLYKIILKLTFMKYTYYYYQSSYSTYDGKDMLATNDCTQRWRHSLGSLAPAFSCSLWDKPCQTEMHNATLNIYQQPSQGITL